ncbi:MAG TPA: GMC oxidoreductase [Pyrinomonadaceae bacterium]|jgi:choline dehydrogenase-like flavoprotein
MSKLLIIGSGASGVHFALSVLRKGYEVIMVDVGQPRPPAVNPEDTFNELKINLDDPVRYFLGPRYEAFVQPGTEGEYYGFPPNKGYVFSQPPLYQAQADGFAPLSSFAQGGLAEAWTGGVYPLNEEELKDFPFSYRDIEPFYSEVAARIGVTGVADDLARFYPLHKNLLAPLRLDQHSQRLLTAYEKQRGHLNDKLNCYLGRARVATLSADKGGRKACTYTGRCLWGCPTGAFYTPSLTLNECRAFPNFTYVPDVYVSHFKYDARNRLTSVVAESPAGGGVHEIAADVFVLAAGTLSSSRIFLDSVLEGSGERIALPGLMDNRQILVPFINLGMIGEAYSPDNYQYHQLALGIESGESGGYIHGLITTLKTALVHPIVQNVPLDLRTALTVFRNVRAGLGVVNVNLSDSRRANNFVTLRTNQDSARSSLFIKYAPPDGERAVIKQAIKTVKKILWRLGCVVPPGMTHVRPMGASVHYAGTIPMSAKQAPYTASAYCQSHDFDNLYFADGTTFPSLPAKNITFTLMANAVRVAEHAF